MSKQTPLRNGLFTWFSEKPQLIGSRCKGSGEHFFPVQKGCSNCSSIDLSTVELGNQGTLWTWTIQGFMPVNTDGGCLANGEPVGASGLRQVFEVCFQLRGQAGDRQVKGNPKLGYTHVYGAPGLSGVTVLEV